MGSFISIMAVLGFLSVFYVFPTMHILLSRRSNGGATFGWILVNLIFPILGWGIFLIATQPEKDRISKAQYLNQIQARNLPLPVKARSPRQHAVEIAQEIAANS